MGTHGKGRGENIPELCHAVDIIPSSLSTTSSAPQPNPNLLYECFNLFHVKTRKTFTVVLKILPNFRDWLSRFGFLLFVMGNSFVRFHVSMETSPRQFHHGEIGHTQNNCFPMGQHHLPIGKIASVTAPIVFLTFSLPSSRWILKFLMFPAKQEQVMSFDVLTYTSRGHACAMEKQTVARSSLAAGPGETIARRVRNCKF